MTDMDSFARDRLATFDNIAVENTGNERDSHIRYAIANPGCNDLIDRLSGVVMPDLVSGRIAQFVAVEVKAGKAVPNKDQNDFLRIVDGAGGRAVVA